MPSCTSACEDHLYTSDMRVHIVGLIFSHAWFELANEINPPPCMYSCMYVAQDSHRAKQSLRGCCDLDSAMPGYIYICIIYILYTAAQNSVAAE